MNFSTWLRRRIFESGYIQKGKGQHYADLFKNKSYIVTPKKLVYSMANGGKLERNL